MKCRIHKCNACCCYNIPFEKNEIERFADKIVNPVLFVLPLVGSVPVAFTNEKPELNKCPFLRKDLKCNIYENRPEVCRKFGQIAELPCRYIRL